MIVKYQNKVVSTNSKWVGYSGEPGPEPLPPYTLRLKFKDGVTPTFRRGTGVLVDATNNIWDLTYENTSWYYLLSSQQYLLEIVNGNTTNVTDMRWTFYGCTSLTSICMLDTSNVTDMSSLLYQCTSLINVPLFNTSKVTDMRQMFRECYSLMNIPLFDTSSVASMRNMCTNCTSLKSIPLFNTSKVTDMRQTFAYCAAVESGALALYQQASTQTNPPTEHSETFYVCGSNTQTGRAELSQIPSDWK